MEAQPGLVTHWSRTRRASIAILDVVSRKWLATLTSAEESSTQVEACFLAALDAEDLLTLADDRATAALREAIARPCGLLVLHDADRDSDRGHQVTEQITDGPAGTGRGPLPVIVAQPGEDGGEEVKSLIQVDLELGGPGDVPESGTGTERQ